MKKLLTAAFLGLLSTGAFAQTTQGSIVVSGSLGFSKSSQESNSNTYFKQKTFGISPSIGFIFGNGLEAGAALGYENTVNFYKGQDSWDEPSEREFTINLYSISPYLKKYFMLSDKFAFTASAQVGVSTGESKVDAYKRVSETEISGFHIAAIPGFVFFPTEKIGITASFGSFGYNEIKYERTDVVEDKDSNTGFNLDGTTLGIGFKYYINR